MPRLKASLIVGKLVILLINFLLILALGEWLFPKFLDKIPLRLYGSIENNLRILAQHSKKNLLPNEYIAIVGDSIAVGTGDWLEEVRKNSFFGSPDYSPAHLIYKKTGIDVVSFGQAGVGSFGGIWREPITQFKYINSVREYHLSPPNYILIFFSETGDIYDNVQFLSGYAQAEKEMVRDFLNSKFEKVLNQNFSKNFWRDMLFTQFLYQGILNLIDEQISSNEKPPTYPKTPVNVALINGEKAPLPMHLSAPPLFSFKESDRILGQKRQLTEEELKVFYITKKEYKLGLFVFEQTLAMLAGFFPHQEIKIVFIPSTLSSYKMVSPQVVYRGMFGWVNIVATTVIEQKHIELCEAIQKIASGHNMSFINTTKNLRKASSMETIHGPIDWDHFNRRGYEALSTDIAQVFLQSGGGVRTDNCVY